MTAEAERIAQCILDVALLSLTEGKIDAVVDVLVLILGVMVDGRRNNSVLQRHDASQGLYGTRGSYAYNTWHDNGRVSFNADPKPIVETKLTDAEMRDPLPREVGAAYQAALNPDAKPGDDFVPSGHGGSHPYLVHEFVSAICEGRRPAVDAWKAASYMAMGMDAHKSAQRDGEIVPVVDFGDPPARD